MKIDAISIDLETLGTRVHAPIVSIGAVQFERSTGKIGETFYREIDINSAIRAGRVDGSTLCWWMQQGDKARRVFSDNGKTPLAVALDDLRAFYLKTPKAVVYGNGSIFDISILEYAYEHGAVGLRHPWDFWLVRDMRTIVEDAGMDGEANKHLWPARQGVHHNALDDAVYQAQVISVAWQRIQKALTLLKQPTAKPAQPVYDPDL